MKQKGHIAYSDIKSKFHVNLPSNPSTPSEKNIMDGKAYRRHTTAVTPGDDLNQIKIKAPDGLSIPNLENSQLMSSCSASHLPQYGMNNYSSETVVKPRLSKSEENLIDLETPDETGFGFTLENPLYDLVTNNAVFEDIVKTDDQLLAEYGLNDFFDKLNLKPSKPFVGNSNQSQGSDKWTTFD